MKKNKKTILCIIVDIMAIGILAASLLGFLGRLSWFIDLFSHFRVQYMQLCLPLIGIALWKRWNKRAGALVFLALINYSFVLPFYFGKPAPPSAKPVRAMLMNIYAGNGNTDLVIETIRAADPDILLLEEVTLKWQKELKVLNGLYTYRISEPRDDCFGIMLLSKYPLERTKVVKIGTADVPSVITEAHLPQGVVSIIGTHPLPPIGEAYSNHRNNQLAALPAHIKGLDNPVLLMGDLNTTPWSPHFKNLIKDSGLKNSMKGFGFQPSWTGNVFLKIPLDHMLHSEEILIHNRMIGPDVGSDHRPVIVDFSLKQ
jgi:endonuclease/exonuclease/phosphatase (EEP) superfamily protein YafD